MAPRSFNEVLADALHVRATLDETAVTRSNVQRCIKAAVGDSLVPDVDFETAGSSRQSLQVRGRGIDHDVLVVIRGIPVVFLGPGRQNEALGDTYTLSGGMAPSGVIGARKLSPSVYLQWLAHKVKRYTETYGGAVARVSSPSVTLEAHSCDFDFIPAFEHPKRPGWYLIPADGDTWKTTSPGEEHVRLMELNGVYTNMRNVLKVLKYIKNLVGAQIPSAAFLHACWHFRSERCLYTWNRSNNWARVLLVIDEMITANGVIPHMYGPAPILNGGKSVLDGLRAMRLRVTG